MTGEATQRQVVMSVPLAVAISFGLAAAPAVAVWGAMNATIGHMQEQRMSDRRELREAVSQLAGLRVEVASMQAEIKGLTAGMSRLIQISDEDRRRRPSDPFPSR